MTTTTVNSSVTNYRVTQARVIRSEWVKLRSLRSTWITLVVSIALMIGFGLLFCWGTESHWDRMDPGERAHFDPTLVSLRGMYLAQLAVGTLGVLVMTGEYATGMIRASLSAVPKRLPVLWGKLVVFGLIAFVAMCVAAFTAFGFGQMILATRHIGTSLSEPGVLRAVVGTAGYLAVVGLLGIALGTMLRNTAGAIATVFGLLLVLPILANVLPHDWSKHITPYLPSNAGQAITIVVPDPTSMAPWNGFGLFCLYTAGAIVVAAVVLLRRDA